MTRIQAASLPSVLGYLRCDITNDSHDTLDRVEKTRYNYGVEERSSICTYDAWGNFITTYYSTIGTNYYAYYNPFRYRGYYYDSETGLYYLQSRYYKPQWGRFLNADVHVNANGDLIGFNMYAYCSNNPVMYTDPTGESIVLSAIIIGAVIGGIIGAAFSVGDQYIENNGDWDQINWLMVAYDGGVGAISGAVSATGIGTVGSIIFGTACGFGSSLLRDSLFYKEKSWGEKFADASWNGIMGGIAGFISGGGANSSNKPQATGHVIENYIHSRGVLQRTIANGTKRAVNHQYMVTTKYELGFIIGGVRYMAGNLFTFISSQMAG